MCLSVPVKVLEILNQETVIVGKSDVKFKASTILLEDVSVGDYVLVHAGFAIEKITDEDAEQKLELYAEYQEKIKEKV